MPAQIAQARRYRTRWRRTTPSTQGGRRQNPRSVARPTDSDIRLHLGRLERLDQEPEELIGAAKDLVEATPKHVLLTLDIPFDRNGDVAALSKQALASLALH